MKPIPRYNFYKTKYGEELLMDVVSLDSIRQYISRHPVHSLSYFDITFITGGSGSFSVDGRHYALCRGDVVFSKPGEVREWDRDELPQGYALIFEEEFLLSFFNDRSFIQNLSYFHDGRVSAKVSVAGIYDRIESLLRHIFTEINGGKSRDKHILRALLYEMLMLLNREYLKSGCVAGEKPRNRYADRFIRLVDRDFKVFHDTRHYAGELCISPNYLNEVVRDGIGTSPKCYIRDKLIREAKVLLSYSSLSVAEIAGDLNFEDSSYFIRLFRRQTNLTPLQYRRSTMR